LSVLDKPFLAKYLIEKYKIECIDLNLPCLSRKACTDYTEVWEKLLELYGIDLNEVEVSECCIGIGKMIIGSNDDCDAFILDSCTDLKESIEEINTNGDFNDDFNDDFSINS